MTDLMCGESSHCFIVTDLENGMVMIHSNNEANSETSGELDTYAAFAKLRDDMKGGVYDHVGEPTSDPYAGCPICTADHCCICSGDAPTCPIQPRHPQRPACVFPEGIVEALVSAYLQQTRGHDARCPVTVKSRPFRECECSARGRAERFAMGAVKELAPFLKQDFLDIA